MYTKELVQLRMKKISLYQIAIVPLEQQPQLVSLNSLRREGGHSVHVQQVTLYQLLTE